MSMVLIVDDDPRMSSALVDEVSSLGFETNAAFSSDSAVEKLLNGQVDVMVTDLRMGGRDGIELIKLTRKISPQTRCVLMSAYATARDYKVAIEQGAVEVLSKPFAPDDLTRVIKQAMQTKPRPQDTPAGSPLLEVVRLFHSGQRDIVIKLGDEQHALYLSQGEIVHAIAGDKKGKEALKVLSERPDSLQTAELSAETERSIEAPFTETINELERMVKEHRERNKQAETPGVIVAPAYVEAVPRQTGDPANSRRRGRKKRRLHPLALATAAVIVLALSALLIDRLRTRDGGEQTDDVVFYSPQGAPSINAPGIEEDDKSETPYRRIKVITNPPGLELVDASNGTRLGRSPLGLRLPPNMKLALQAVAHGQKSEKLQIGLQEGDAEFDLSNWVASVTPKKKERRVVRRRPRKTPPRTAAAPTPPPEPPEPTPPPPKKPKFKVVDDLPAVGVVDEKLPAVGTVR